MRGLREMLANVEQLKARRRLTVESGVVLTPWDCQLGDDLFGDHVDDAIGRVRGVNCCGVVAEVAEAVLTDEG